LARAQGRASRGESIPLRAFRSTPPALKPMTAGIDHPTEAPRGHRPVRSFVRRSGRLTEAQARALRTLAPGLALPADGACALDMDRACGRQAPRVLEIGFGDGEALLHTAWQHADHDFLGIEVHEPGVGHLLLGVERLGITNVRVLV